MAKRVVLAVAGAGKTKLIIDQLELNSRALIITYTLNNTSNIKGRILEKFGFIPKGIRVYTYFSFLMSFCIRPVAGNDIKVKGISYSVPILGTKRQTEDHYLVKGRLYHNRIAKLLADHPSLLDGVTRRIEKYFDFVCVDEVQDFAANDFNLLCALSKLNTEMLLVGDFYQHTFDTSRDGPIRKNLHKNYDKYLNEFRNSGFEVDSSSLSRSHRCSPTICNFVSDSLGIPIKSNRTDVVNIEFVTAKSEIHQLMSDNAIAKLFYQGSNKYIGWTDNWGNTKGLDDFQDICVVLNKTSLLAYKNGKLSSIAPSSLNKLYVACTRTKGNLFLIAEDQLKAYKK